MKFLISKQEYYRANVELNRLKSYYPNFIPFGKYHITGRYLLFKGEQFDEIIKSRPDQTGIIKKIDDIFTVDSYHMKKNYLKADHIISSWIFCNKSIDNSLDFDKYYFKRKMFNLMMMSKFDSIYKLKNQYQCIDFSKYNELVKYAKKEYDMLKYPMAGAFLNLIPGMGYIYSDNVGTGITAFIVISLSATASYFAFRTNNKTIGIFVAAVGTFLYSGNVVGGYLAAKRYNRDRLTGLNNYLLNKLSFYDDRDEIFNRFGTGNHVKRK